MSALNGKVAIVTGASLPNGIGLAIGKAFAKIGASLYLVAEGTREQLETSRKECEGVATGGARIEFGLHDLAVAGGAEAMVEEAHKRFGRVDILLNNAAVRVDKDLGTYTRADFDKVIGVNLAAPFFACQAVIPIMRKQGGGRIINIASQVARAALPQRALYGISKAGVVRLTMSRAFELGREGIMVNSISPGPVQTQRALSRIATDPELHKKLEAEIPLGRSGQPSEIAEVAVFLATTNATYLQGEDICVDGGYTIH
jgi:NAD(P)-dependent dehydrogenase (short-subunit alcohol dehydrogenase family)